MKILSVIGVNEANFETGFDVDISLERDINDIMISIKATLETCDVDIVLINLQMRYKKAETLFLKYGVDVYFNVKDWTNETSEKSDIDIKDLPEVKQMVELSLGILRGAMAVRSNIQPKEYLQSLYLPIIPSEELVKRLTISKHEIEAQP